MDYLAIFYNVLTQLTWFFKYRVHSYILVLAVADEEIDVCLNAFKHFMAVP